MGKRRNIIVGQSGGPTTVTNSNLAGVYKTTKERGFHKVYRMLHGIEGLLEEMYMDLPTQAHSDMDIELLERTPSAFLDSCRYKLPDIHEDPGLYEKIFGILDELQIRVFIYIGGNDSADTIKKLSNYAIMKGHDQKFLGVPRTIDNDLVLADHTPGLRSAAKYVATPIREVMQDAMGLSSERKTVTIIECVGKNAGWLTGSTALVGTKDCCGPDLIYLLEIPFDIDKLLKKCKGLIEKEPSNVIAISERIRILDRRYVCQLAGGSDYADAFGHKQLADMADYLAGFLAAELGYRTRSAGLSILQRSASHMTSRVDINEIFMVGGAAVKATDERDTGEMMVIDRVSDDLYINVAGIYDVRKIVDNEKVVPRNWVNKNGSYVTQESISYVESLIQGGYRPFMVNGLPQHLVLKR